MKEVYIVEVFEIEGEVLTISEILDVFDTADKAKEFITEEVKTCVTHAREQGVSSKYLIDPDAIVFLRCPNGEGVKMYDSPNKTSAYVYTKWTIK